MSRTSTLIALGIITLVVPFSGLPMALRTLITIACGASVLSIGLIQRSREAKMVPPPAEPPTIPSPPSDISPI